MLDSLIAEWTQGLLDQDVIGVHNQNSLELLLADIFGKKLSKQPWTFLYNRVV